MNLKDWIKKKNMNFHQFSKRFGVSYAFLYRHMHGLQRFSPEMAVKIEEFTKGEVSRTEAMWPEINDKTWLKE